MQKFKNIEAILFDLDGTLLDTAQDLIQALNSVIKKNFNHSTFDLKNEFSDDLRAAAGQGCKGLLKTGLNIDFSDSRYPTLADELLLNYTDCLLNTTQLFSGMDSVLNFLDQKNIPWGIVTNKPAKFTQLILNGLNISARAQCIISGDSLTNRKPHPEPILHASHLLQKSPKNCLYIGDSEVDVIASKAAGSPSLVALYGYIAKTENPLTWKADGYIQHPNEILSWI